MEIPEARWVVWGTILVIAVVVAVYFAKLFRDMATGERAITNGNILSDFEQLRDQGRIDEEEFKRLKTTIREQQATKNNENNENNESNVKKERNVSSENNPENDEATPGAVEGSDE